MTSCDLTPAKNDTRIPFAWVAVGVAAAWLLVHVAVYAVQVYRLGPETIRQTLNELRYFFSWQAAGFFAVALVVEIRRPAIIGGVIGLYLTVSTLVLLAFSHDAVLVGKFVLLMLWAVCAANSMRQLIAHAVGQPYATWGVAAAGVYAALIPICFFLGIAHAITPTIVTLLAVATALPGAVGWLRCLTTLPLTMKQSFIRLGIVDVMLLEVIWYILAIGFVFASSSEVLSDSSRVHLPYINQVVADHGISHQYVCWHRLQPMAVQACYAAFACLGSDTAARWFSWLGLVTLILLVAEEVYRRSLSTTLGLFAGAAVLACPMLTWVSRALYIDHIITLLCTAGFIVLFRALRPPCLRGILFSAAIMGSMVQVKYPGLVFCVVWGLFLTATLLRHCNWRVALRWSTAAAAMLVATALPWYVYVYLGTGNPFYPYLNSWFPSPYWQEGFSLQQVFEGSFKLDPGIAGVLSFPWIATLQTHRFVEQCNGFLGFWALALAPCWFLARSRHALPHYWDMAIVGVAMIACVVAYTPYIRYWLPAYPLLVTSCVLAAGALLRHVKWPFHARWLQACWGVALVAVLFLPVAYSSLFLPWQEYTKQMSVEDQIAKRYGGYEAIKRLNAILDPSEGVVCTRYEGIHLIHGRAYEFAFWWNGIHHITDLDSFADFCQQNGIRYWVVDQALCKTYGTGDELGISQKYWTDSRLVFADGTVAIYDVTAECGASMTSAHKSLHGMDARCVQ